MKDKESPGNGDESNGQTSEAKEVCVVTGKTL